MKTREEILASAQQFKTREVFVPEWDTTIRLRRMELPDMFRLRGLSFEEPSHYVEVILLTAITETGERLFRPEDAETVAKLEPAALMLIGVAAVELNTISINEIKEQLKNFEPGPRDDSSSS